LEQFRLQKENYALKEKLRDDFFNHYFVGKHPKFLKVVQLIRKIAETESNALVQGESGTGKELAARAIHLHSRRAERPFLVVDCATLTKEMIEAAPASRSGLEESAKKSIFEVADGGTLFLEHVEELNPAIQARLIRILQDRKVPRGCEWEWVSVNVRLIASTTTDLYSAVTQKKFRENLYYSLNVVNINLPSLWERKEDIGILCDHFFRQIADRGGTKVHNLHPDTLAKLMEYDWPGNVRQLQNVIERVVSLSENMTLMVKNLPDEIKYYNGNVGLSFKDAKNKWLRQFEKLYLENLLFTNKGNISRASEMAGIARMSLYRMLKRTGLHELVMHERLVEKNQAKQPVEEEPVE
jgi:DNA-binding NtrC family response regulator